MYIRTFRIKSQNEIWTRKYGYSTGFSTIDTRPAIEFTGTPDINVRYCKKIN